MIKKQWSEMATCALEKRSNETVRPNTKRTMQGFRCFIEQETVSSLLSTC